MRRPARSPAASRLAKQSLKSAFRNRSIRDVVACLLKTRSPDERDTAARMIAWTGGLKKCARHFPDGKARDWAGPHQGIRGGSVLADGGALRSPLGRRERTCGSVCFRERSSAFRFGSG